MLVMAKLFNTLEDAILRDVLLEVLTLDDMGNRIAQERVSFRYLFPPEKRLALCRNSNSMRVWRSRRWNCA